MLTTEMNDDKLKEDAYRGNLLEETYRAMELLVNFSEGWRTSTYIFSIYSAGNLRLCL